MSFTIASFMNSEHKKALREALTCLCVGLSPVDGSLSVAWFAALVGDEVPVKHRVVVEVGNA